MDRINHAAFEPSPYDPTQKLPKGPSLMFDPSGQAFVAEWLAHVAAGRIGGSAPVNEAARAIVLANERLICGTRG